MGLHCTAFLGLVDIKVALSKIKKWDSNIMNSETDTALMLAATSRHERVVKILSGRIDVNPDMADSWGQRPLSAAVGNRHTGVVKIPLERTSVYSELTDDSGRTPRGTRKL